MLFKTLDAMFGSELAKEMTEDTPCMPDSEGSADNGTAGCKRVKMWKQLELQILVS